MIRRQVQLWYKRLKEGREDGNDDARPARSSPSTTYENIETVKKMILGNRQIRGWDIVWLMSSNYYGCFRHELCGSEDYSKIAKF